MIISNFASESDPRPAREELSWHELADRLAAPTPVPCTLESCPRGNKCSYKKGKAWSVGCWPEGERRAKDTAEYGSCLVVDLDHLADAVLEQARDRLAGRSYLMHSSHSDRPGDRCVRVALELSRPVPGLDFSRFWTTAVKHLGLLELADKHCRHVAALYFYPTRPSDLCQDASDGSGYDFDYQEGAPLDVGAVLALAEPLEERSEVRREVPEFRSAPSQEALDEAARVLGRAWPPRGERHSAQLALAGALAHAGWPAELIAGFSADVAEEAEPGTAELGKREETAKRAVSRLGAGEAVSGWPSLEELVDPDAIQQARDLLGLSLPRVPADLMERLAARATYSAKLATQKNKEAERGTLKAMAGKAASRVSTVVPTRDELDADLELAVAECKKSRDRDRRADGKLLKKLLKNEVLSRHGDEDLKAALDRAAVAAARVFRPGATPGQLAEYLLPCAGYLASYVDEIATDAFRAAEELGPLVVTRSSVVEFVGSSDDESVRSQLQLTDKGEVKNCGHNLERIFRYSSELGGKLRFNVLEKRVEVGSSLFSGDAPNVLPVSVMSWLGSAWGLSTSSDKVGEMLLMVSRKYGSYHPVQEELSSLQWDGTQRAGGPDCPGWLTRYCGAADTPYTRRLAGYFMVSAVARAFVPGCKVDTVMVLEGQQGAYKSTALRVLGSPWFSDTPMSLGDKDAYLAANSKWIIEFADLSTVTTPGEYQRYKAFLSSPSDFVRPPYGHAHEDFLRSCVFVGTHNPHGPYLDDPTGGRRWWPVQVTRCDKHALERDRDQLWAEVVHRYRTADLNPELAHEDCPGERWWFEPGEQDIADQETRMRTMENPWVETIRAWVDRQSRPTGAGKAQTQFTLARIAEDALGLTQVEIQRSSRQVAGALRSAGFEFVAVGTEKRGVWVRSGTVVQESQKVVDTPQEQGDSPLN